MKQRFLFVRPPRPLWPFNGPSSAFWPPLAFASLAAALRDEVPDLVVEILDAPALKMGWRTLEAELHRRRPDYVGLGEEAVSCLEGLRAAQLAQASGARVIAGGCFFGHVAGEVLRGGAVDVVVHGEGERTLVELVAALQSSRRQDLRWVEGISFRDGEEVVTTPPRSLLPNLDELPWPAYDLLPVDAYGGQSRNHPRLAAIELGRGCVGACDFCILWRQMGRFVEGHPVPHLRVKSPERLVEEIRVLVKRYDRAYLGWVDPCYNAHPGVPGQLGERLLREGMQIGQSAWVRSDFVVRDARSGALESCVRSGLNELYLGIERPDAAGLQALHKTSRVEDALAALGHLRKHHPQVLNIGSFIYGLPGDTPATMRALHRLAFELELDDVFYIPLTHLPGTTFWKPELWDATGREFRSYGFLPGASSHPAQLRLERALLRSILFDWPLRRLRSNWRRLWQGDARKRRVNRRLMGHALRFHARRLTGDWLGGRTDHGLLLPSWYEQ